MKSTVFTPFGLERSASEKSYREGDGLTELSLLYDGCLAIVQSSLEGFRDLGADRRPREEEEEDL